MIEKRGWSDLQGINVGPEEVGGEEDVSNYGKVVEEWQSKVQSACIEVQNFKKVCVVTIRRYDKIDLLCLMN